MGHCISNSSEKVKMGKNTKFDKHKESLKALSTYHLS